MHQVHSPKRIAAGLAIAAAAASFTCGSSARAQQYEARTVAPRAPEHPGRADAMLALTGVVVFGMPYGVSAWAASKSSIEADRWLYVPVAGPWVDLIERGTCRQSGCSGNLAADSLPLAISGLAQAAGVVILVTTVASPGIAPESAYARREPPKLVVRVAPSGFVGGAGLSAYGAF
jgi:hypothetical protein